jgi:hypothetical protein
MAFKTLSELIDDTRALLMDSTTTPAGNTKTPRFSNAVIASRLNDACMILIRDTINQDNSPWSGSFSTADGTKEYKLTTYPLKILWLSITDGSGIQTVLPWTTRAVMNKQAPLWLDEGTGTPFLYMVDGDVVTLHFTPNATLTVNYGYIRKPNVFAATDLTTEPFNSELALEPLQPALPIHAAMMLSIADEKKERATVLSALWRDELKKIKRYLDNRTTGQDSIQMANSRAAGEFDWLRYKTP